MLLFHVRLWFSPSRLWSVLGEKGAQCQGQSLQNIGCPFPSYFMAKVPVGSWSSPLVMSLSWGCIHLSVHPSIHPITCPSVHPSTRPSTHPPIILYPFTHPPIYPSFCSLILGL